MVELVVVIVGLGGEGSKVDELGGSVGSKYVGS